MVKINGRDLDRRRSQLALHSSMRFVHAPMRTQVATSPLCTRYLARVSPHRPARPLRGGGGRSCTSGVGSPSARERAGGRGACSLSSGP
eukprot:scaffold2304_cov30-Tisochrysis_lutea.AAC.2